jgi:mono/diheme cytochrome c family protein
MTITKNLIITFLICFYFSNAFSQSRKFPSPASADAITNPLKGNAEATSAGKKIYTQYCVTCHGNKGKGDGIAAPGLSKIPADHTSDFVQKQTDGALFWIITQGNNPMPTYKTTLTETQRWQVINYIRTLAKKPK